MTPATLPPSVPAGRMKRIANRPDKDSDHEWLLARCERLMAEMMQCFEVAGENADECAMCSTVETWTALAGGGWRGERA